MTSPDVKPKHFISEPLAPLVAGMNQGDPIATSWFCEVTLPRVTNISRAAFPANPQDADDAVQSYYQSILENPQSIEPRSEGEIVQYIDRGITLKTIHARAKVTSFRSRHPSMDAEYNPETGENHYEQLADPRAYTERILERKELGREVQKALNSLKPNQRRALSLVYLEDLTYDEAAQRTGEKLSTFKTHIRRGKENMRKKMKNPYSDTD